MWWLFYLGSYVYLFLIFRAVACGYSEHQKLKKAHADVYLTSRRNMILFIVLILNVCIPCNKHIKDSLQIIKTYHSLVASVIIQWGYAH